ncbi:MAG TPA: hypothetical protein DD441_15810, partial [Parabacteroides distasonis]|nr:hypothetical protein [Parabacteroides distasonis]
LLREEKFNIEITFYFPEIDNKIIFYTSPKIEILKGIYPNIDYKTLILHPILIITRFILILI